MTVYMPETAQYITSHGGFQATYETSTVSSRVHLFFFPPQVSITIGILICFQSNKRENWFGPFEGFLKLKFPFPVLFPFAASMCAKKLPPLLPASLLVFRRLSVCLLSELYAVSC